MMEERVKRDKNDRNHEIRKEKKWSDILNYRFGTKQEVYIMKNRKHN